MENKEKSFYTEWLEKIQQESWQLELLISGFALYGILNSGDIVRNIINHYYINFDNFFPGSNFLAGSLFDLLDTTRKVLTINLLIHIFLRGLWIAVIGLRYVSGNINLEKFHYSEIWRKEYKKDIYSFDKYIEKLERLSCIIFPFSFLIIFFNISVTLIIVFIFIIPLYLVYALNNILPDNNSVLIISIFVFIIYILIALILCILSLIDYILLGKIKKIRNKRFSNIYFRFSKFIGFISGQFLYRNIYYNFIDNKITRVYFYISIVYTFWLLLGPDNIRIFNYFPPAKLYRASGKNSEYNQDYYRHYDDEIINVYPKQPINIASIPSLYVQNNFSSIFIKIDKSSDKSIACLFPNIHKLSNTGMNYSLESDEFWNDSILNRIDTLSSSSTIENYKHIQVKNIDTSLISGKVSKLNLNKLLKYKYKNIYIIDKEEEVINAYKSIFTITIDSTYYTDSLFGQFYYHPNMNETGIRYIFSVKNLTPGNHIIHLIKSSYDYELFNRGKVNISQAYLNIPFVKI